MAMNHINTNRPATKWKTSPAMGSFLLPKNPNFSNPINYSYIPQSKR